MQQIHSILFSIVGKIIQIALLVISGVLLFISGTSIGAGWDQTCENIEYVTNFTIRILSIACNCSDFYRDRNEGSDDPITCKSEVPRSSFIFNYKEVVGSVVSNTHACMQVYNTSVIIMLELYSTCYCNKKPTVHIMV